jgi:peptidoglycan/xylan/chitin deacetylase (PgdA/CDA1 family)
MHHTNDISNYHSNDNPNAGKKRPSKKRAIQKTVLGLLLSAVLPLSACSGNALSNNNKSAENGSGYANEQEISSGEASELESETDELQALYREDADGNPVEGWLTDDDGTVGYCQNGYLLTGYQMIDGSRYLFTDDGDMRTGSYTDENGDKYCFTDDGRQYFDSTVKCEDGYYYFGNDGKAVTGNFTFSDGSTGMTDADGHVYVGCHRIGDLVYDFTSQGKLRHTVDATRPMVALTYDDGPSTQNTQIILDTLTANGAYATFFVLGRNVERCADIIQNIEASGSEIGNHTYNHYKITNMDAQVTDQEISSTSSYVQMITGNRPSIMRPPTGATDDVSCANVAAVDDGYPLIMWCVDTVDWQHHDVATTCDIIRSKVKDGAIVLMHDMEASSAQASQIMIPELIAAGYELVTVSEMAAARGGMVVGQVYNYFDPALGQTQAETEIQPVTDNQTDTTAPTETQMQTETDAPVKTQSQVDEQAQEETQSQATTSQSSDADSSDDRISVIFPWEK